MSLLPSIHVRLQQAQERHEEIVNKLIEGGVVRREDIGNIEVRRVPPEKAKSEQVRREEPADPEKHAEGEGA